MHKPENLHFDSDSYLTPAQIYLQMFNFKPKHGSAINRSADRLKVIKRQNWNSIVSM